ncbi:hypothetical protein TEA_000296 [Camellia sinensis var. sinensis]|uniref:Legumain prodomain domain-containing protein n=1 Tax=Camellia sinensis var. sinensis TaxID=542762 RepID=A0A4V3WQU4_CAMSN|nr:hypothetical protein TEA_000296 [Camellia sinensis var. sinensis]
MIRLAAAVLVLSLLAVDGREIPDDLIRLPSEASRFFNSGGGADDDGDDSVGTRWAVLIAGSNGYWNYRHQADVCHAYQLLKKGGLKDENIIVFMYDDIAQNEENPRPGIIINSPHGDDVYKGVPKDYTGENVTVNNFFSVILGNKTALTGGSGKVVDSGPTDHIFIFYSDHGGPGVLAANAEESSWGTYCPGEDPSPPEEYETCLGDLYSVAWMEDSDTKNLRTETLRQQYELVKMRTANGNSAYGSHVMQFGDLQLSKEDLFLYMGTNPANDNYSFVNDNFLLPPSKAVNQRDADLLHFWDKFRKAPEGSPRKLEAQKQFVEAMSHRMHIDNSMKMVGKLLFGIEKGPEVLNTVRPSGQPLVDDWDCLKTLVRTFETHCGSLSQYGMKHMRSVANICNAGIQKEQMAEASAQACITIPSGHWSSLHKGFSA